MGIRLSTDGAANALCYTPGSPVATPVFAVSVLGRAARNRLWYAKMRIVRNVGHVKRRKRIARWSALLGFLLLAGTFFIALRPGLLLFAYVLLFGGFILFNLGMQQVGKWSRTPRNDQMIDNQLANLNDRFTLIHFAQIGKRVVEHMLVYPGGVVVMTAKELPGAIVAKNGRWRKGGGGIRRLFGFSGPQLGQPSSETKLSVDAVETALAAAQLEVDVTGAIIFLNPRAELDVTGPDFPAIYGDELPQFVRDLPVDESIRPGDREALVALLSVGEELETTGGTPVRRRPVRKRPVRKRAA